MKFEKLYEEFVDADNVKNCVGKEFYVEIFRNPTSKELSECGPFSRGFIMPTGDVYIASNTREVSHADLLRYMKSHNIGNIEDEEAYWNFHNYRVEGVCIQQMGSSRDFYIGESALNLREREMFNIMILMKRAEKLNPLLNFIPEKIELGRSLRDE